MGNDRRSARRIINLIKNMNSSTRSKTTALLLVIFFGVFGVHRFYAGRVVTGVIQLLLTMSLVGILITSPWALIDFIMILTNSFKDDQGRFVDKWDSQLRNQPL